MSPGPTVMIRTPVSIRRAAIIRPVSAGTTLARIAPWICWGSLWWRVSRCTSRMAYSSDVAAAADSLPANCSAPSAYAATVIWVLPILTVRIMVASLGVLIYME